MLPDAEVARIIGAELDAAIQLANSADGGRRQMALDYAAGDRPANDDPAGDINREAVSLDVADMVEAVYAQMAPALEDAGGIQFDAYSADDEPQAQKESAIVRSMLMEGYSAEGGFVALSEAIKDSLLLRSCALALYVDRIETREPESWEAVPGLGVADKVKPNQPGQRIEAVQIEPDDKSEPREDGQDQFTVSLDRVSVDKRLCLHCVPRENFVTSSMQERDPNLCRFVADRMVTTRARLVAEGFPKAAVAKLKQHDPTSYALYLKRSDGADVARSQAAQPATETVEVWRCYVQLADTPTDVEAKRYRVYYSRDSKELLGKPERVGRVCYGVGNTMLYPHRMDGVSLFDRIGEVQEVKTRLLRNWIENAHKVNRPKLGVVESLANIADAKDATADVVRLKGPNALFPVPTQDAGPSMMAALNYMDQARSERGGAALDMQAAGVQIATNQTAQGIERQYSVKEQLAAMMARTFGETALRSAFQIAHYLLRTAWGDTLTVKVDGNWVEVNPAEWRPRNGVRIRVGQSESQRSKRVVALQGVMGMQTAAMQAGYEGVLTDPSRVYNAAYDLITASMLAGPERYLIDPQSPQGKQGMQAKQQSAAAANAAQQAGMRAAMMLDKYKTDVKGFTDMVDTIVKAAIEEAKLAMTPEPIEQAQQVASSAAAGLGNQAAQGAQQAGGGGNGPQQPEQPQVGALPQPVAAGGA